MVNQTFSFYYDPVRQGYDSNTWTTVSGAPVVAANKLSLDAAEILHFADLLRGDAVFSINMSAPAAGDDVKFGFIEYNKGAKLLFMVADDVFTAESSDGTTAESAVIAWNTDWSNADIEFRIKWEAGMATFFVDGRLMATFNDTSALGVPTIAIPNDPMSLYVSNDSNDPLLVNYIDVSGVQTSNLDNGSV